MITQLVKQHKEVKDKVTKIKLKETINVLRKTKIGRVVSDNQVSAAMMINYELISEIKNVRKKLKEYIRNLVQEMDEELDEITTTKNIDGFDTPYGFSEQKIQKR